MESLQESTRDERERRDAKDEETADSYSLSADHTECLEMEYGSDAEYGLNSDEEDRPCTLHDDGSTCQSCYTACVQPAHMPYTSWDEWREQNRCITCYDGQPCSYRYHETPGSPYCHECRRVGWT